MKHTKLVALIVALAFAPAVLQAGDYKFTVKNKTKVLIVKLLAKEKGSKQWGFFDIGKGIRPGQTTTLEWDQSTDNAHCEWAVKAKYADGSESEPATFNFCENPDIEFED